MCQKGYFQARLVSELQDWPRVSSRWRWAGGLWQRHAENKHPLSEHRLQGFTLRHTLSTSPVLWSLDWVLATLGAPQGLQPPIVGLFTISGAEPKIILLHVFLHSSSQFTTTGTPHTPPQRSPVGDLQRVPDPKFGLHGI